LVLVAEKGDDEYVRKSLENVRKLATKNGNEEKVRELKDRREIERVVGTGGWSGEWGYINRSSGWADAEAAMKFARRKVEETGRVQFRTGEAKRLLQRGRKIVGVELSNDNIIQADLVMLATGAWTGALVDLRGRAEATGQVLAYMDITQDEQDRLEKIPVLLNTSTGLFIIPPRNRLLKVARHGYGYTNPQRIPHPNRQGEVINISTPSTGGPIPAEGESACRQALVSMLPHLASRPFCKTRICWYTDTPTGDFIITHHPEYDGLFLATGGSGHAFKFLPVIGEKIVDAIGGWVERELVALWGWREGRVEVVVTEDGSRGGRRGMVLGEEMGKGERSRL